MKQTRLKLTRRFLTEIGFIEACHRPFGRALPAARGTLRAAFNSTLEALEKQLVTYEPARWVGYYVDRKVNRGMVHDGLFHIPVPLSGVFITMLDELRRTTFADLNGPLPIEGGIILTMPEPAQILMHDTVKEITYLEPFEAGVMYLWQTRGTLSALRSTAAGRKS